MITTAAFQPVPLMAVYYASKAFVLLFSEAIASELAGSGVTVTALMNKAAIHALRLSPRRLTLSLVRKLQERR